MALSASDEKLGFNRDLYKALMEGNGERVIQLCNLVPEGPLYTLTIHGDTVLHMATYSKQKNLVLNLLQNLPVSQVDRLTVENNIGNTVLHEAATSNRIVPAAKEMLSKAPRLLDIRNLRGETALFRAARYGKSEMFKFLDGEVNKHIESEGELDKEVEEEKRKGFYQRDDQTTILHISILSEHFGLALYIAKEHEYLVSARDEDGMTALQLLSCNPSAFRDGNGQGYLMQLIFACVSTGEDDLVTEEELERCCRVPLWEAIRGRKKKYKSAVELMQLLVARDISWEATELAIDQSKPRTHRYGSTSFPSQSQSEVSEEERTGQTGQVTSTNRSTAETPLILATKAGILEIVEEILYKYPQAVEHIDDEGRNILHVAIKYRQIHIFDFVEKLEIPMMRLVRKIDKNGNSILHMVGMKADHEVEDMRSPALLLQESLLLYERLEKISTTHFTKHYNNDGVTAEKLFTENNDQLQTDAKEWLKRTAENCSIVAVLIATVAFAAAYTVPGGPNQNTGYPILSNQSFFVIFTLADVLSLTLALTSVITFLSILTSPFRLKDFKQSLPQKLMLGVTLLILSVSMMMLSFAATVILLIRNREQWTRIALYLVAFLPVSIFALSYFPLYIALVRTFMYSAKKISEAFPRFNAALIKTWVADRFRSGKTRSPTPSVAAQSVERRSSLRYVPESSDYPV